MNSVFIIFTIFAVFALFLYVVICYMIIRHPRDFKSSYYKLFFVLSVVNALTYINGMLVQRLPRATCPTCAFSGLYLQNHFWGLEGMVILVSYLPAMQYIYSTIICVNRLMAIVMLQDYESIWRKILVPVIILGGIIAITPTTITRLVVNGQVLIPVYFAQNDAFYITADPKWVLKYPINGAIYALFFTVVNVILNVWTIYRVYKMRKELSWTTSPEVKLVAHSIVLFFGEFFVTANSLLISVVTTEPWNNLLLTMLPYSSDFITLMPSFALVCCSQQLRSALKKWIIPGSQPTSFGSPSAVI